MIEYLFCFGQMSFWLFEFRNSGKFGDYFVDNILKIEKIKRSVRGGGDPPERGPFSGFRYMGIKGRDFTS